MTRSEQTGPAFTGLKLQEDREWRYYFWYPKSWHAYALDGERNGFLCSPMSQAPTTFFSVEVVPLEVSVQAEDVDDLVAGAQEGLNALSGLQVESSTQSAAGARIEIERVLTFQDGESTRKRRIRLIYDQDRLYSLISQGATAEEYEYWLSMLNYCHLTFELGLFSFQGLDPSALAQRP